MTPDMLQVDGIPTTKIDLPGQFLLRYHGSDDADTYDGRKGRCYELAGRAVINLGLQGWRTQLVHGVFGPYRMPHAWVTFRLPDGTRYVWDAVIDSVMDARQSAEVMRWVEWVRYGPVDTARLLDRTENWGPWGMYDRRYTQALGVTADLFERDGRHVDAADARRAALEATT